MHLNNIPSTRISAADQREGEGDWGNISFISSKNLRRKKRKR
jgi:hypothetical protein